MKQALLLLTMIAACGRDVAPTGDAPQPTGEPVYYGQVQAILNENCVECHNDDPARLAPFSLTTYEGAVTGATDFAMAFEVMNRNMPPYFAQQDGDCNTYSNAHWLTQTQLDTLVAWINGDQLEGDPADSVDPPPPPPGLAQVDVSVDIGADYLPVEPTPGVPDDYQCFVIAPLTAFDNQFVIGAHVKPTNLAVAHHVILYTLDAAAETDVDARLAAAGNGVSYPCPAGPTQMGRADFLVGWAPGQQAQRFPTNTGIRVDGTRKMVLQMHYNTANSNGQPDRTKIELDFAANVTLPARMVKVSVAPDLDPGQVDVTAEGNTTIPPSQDGQLWGAMIHMHGRGTSAKVTRTNTNNECLMELPNWDFHWQHLYMYDEPIAITGGDQLKLVCHYDTSADTARVGFCENTDCEMCIAFGYVSR